MVLETTEKDISIAYEKLAITSNGGDHEETPRTIFLHIKSKILALMGEIREKKTSLDIDAMSEDIMKSEASNVDKNLIETIIAELTKQKVIAYQKTCHELDPFDKGPTAKQSIDFTIIKPSPSN